MKRALPIIAGVALLCATGGCYKRVVSERGVGAKYSNTKVYEPNYKPHDEAGPLDKAADVLIGKEPHERR